MKSDRTELFDALSELQRRYPQWRFGQLISNIAGWADQSVWDIEDERFLAAVMEHLRACTTRVEIGLDHTVYDGRPPRAVHKECHRKHQPH
jgi:hypothetical protein